MKTPEPDHNLVEYLYDELSPEERKAFTQRLEQEPEVAAEVEALSATLRLYRDAAEEEIRLSPVVLERIRAEATRATTPFWKRLFGAGAASLILRPAVGIAALAVITIGVAVFVFLQGQPDPGAKQTTDRSNRLARVDKNREAPRKAAPGAVRPSLRSVAERDPSAVDSEKSPSESSIARASTPPPTASPAPKPARVGLGGGGLARKKAQSMRRGRRGAYALRGQVGAGGATGAPKTTGSTADALQLSKRRDEGRVLRDEARRKLSQGKLAQACSLYGRLVRQHAKSPSVATYLLEQADCEMKRGNYVVARRLARRVVKNHPRRAVHANALLARVRVMEQKNYARRSRRRYRAPKAAARARPRRPRHRASPSKGDSFESPFQK